MNFKSIFTGPLCNNNCIFCFNDKKKRNKSNGQIKNELNKLKENNLNLSFYGGEITIRDDFFDLTHSAKELNFQNIRIETNARIFASKEFCQKTIDAGVTEFSVSLHGFCGEQHDYITRTPHSFKQTTRGIKNLISLDQKVSANIVIVKPNFRDLSKILRALELLKIKHVNFQFVNPEGNAFENFESIVPLYTLAAPFISKVINQSIEKNIKTTVSSIPYCFIPGYEKYLHKNIFHEESIKFEKCENCYFNNRCNGIWKNYIEKAGEREFEFLKN